MTGLLGNIIFFASLGALIFISICLAAERQSIRQEQGRDKEVTE